MKFLRYLLGVMILLSGTDLMLTTNVYGCPRCRRALPKGPRKKPHPGFSNKQKSSSPTTTDQTKNTPESCSSCCCCPQQKNTGNQHE